MKEEFWTRPVLRVRDVAASIAYYRDRLGFTKRWEYGGDHPIIAEVERGGSSIILDSASAVPKPAATAVLTMSLHKPEELGRLHDDLVARGARIGAAPFPVKWQEGTYQFDVEDLDGNILVFWGARPE